MSSNRLSLSAFVALAAMLTVSPAVAQGKGHGSEHGNGHGNHDRPRQEVRREDTHRKATTRRSESTRVERRTTRSVPRGWCQGRGNPHNVARNCGYRGSVEGIYRDRDGRLRDRIGRVIMGDGRVYDLRTGTYLRIR